MKKVKINEGHYIELMDRIHVQMCVLEDHVNQHPLTSRHKKIKNLIEKSLELLWDAYQEVGNKHHKIGNK